MIGQEYLVEEGMGGTPVKAFLVYVGREFYPGAVTQDLMCSTDTLDEAHEARILRTDPSDEYEWWAIVEHATMQIVAEGSGTQRQNYAGEPADV